MRAALKVMLPILSRWSMTSKTNAGGVTVEGKPSHQYYCYFLVPHDRWQQMGSLTKWHPTWKKGSMEFSSIQRKWHSLAFSQHLLNVYGDRTVDIGWYVPVVVTAT